MRALERPLIKQKLAKVIKEKGWWVSDTEKIATAAASILVDQGYDLEGVAVTVEINHAARKLIIRADATKEAHAEAIESVKRRDEPTVH